MNVLIVSYYFSPINRIASVRMSKVAYKLAEQGHRVEVICYEPDVHEKEDLAVSDLIGVHANLHINRVSWDMNALPEKMYYKALSYLKKRNEKKVHTEKNVHIALSYGSSGEYIGRSFKANVAESVLDRLYRNKNVYMARNARRTVLEVKRNGFSPELIIASYEPLVSLIVGKYCKKQWPKSTLVYDFRDVMTNHYYGKHKGFIEDRICRRLIKEERILLEECDVATVVSNGQKQMILDRQPSADRELIHVIYNGFDQTESGDDNTVTFAHNGTMTVAFTGTLQKKRMTGFVFFLSILKEMFDDKQIIPSQISIKYAGHNADELKKVSEMIGVSDIMEIHDHISREEAMTMQKNADFLLNLVWNERYDQGILGGKFGEYMANRKPILGIVSGELPDSDLYKEIYRRGIGECFEIVRGEEEKDRLKQFICDFLAGKLSYSYSSKAVDDFNYDKIAGCFLAIRK